MYGELLCPQCSLRVQPLVFDSLAQETVLRVGWGLSRVAGTEDTYFNVFLS